MGSKPTSIYSASSIAAILGLSPYTTQFHAWQLLMELLRPGFNAEKGYTLPEFPDNAPIRWGNAFEDAIIKLAEEKHERKIMNCEKSYIKLFNDFDLSCHIDGEYLPMPTESKEMILHEGKSTWSRAFYSIKGEDCNDETGEIEFKRRWGEPGTDEVPVEYQIQASVQRICTEAELVRLSVLVFPKSTQEFEELGWKIEKMSSQYGILNLDIPDGDYPSTGILPIDWAHVFQQIGNFHTYNLPTNKKLESLIIEKIQEFDKLYVKTELPPPATNYPDIRRLITQPMGTIIANDEMIAKANEYSEIVRQVGDRGPMKKRQEILKEEIMTWMNTQRKDDWAVPNDKMVLVSPDGGDQLISFSKSGFRARSA